MPHLRLAFCLCLTLHLQGQPQQDPYDCLRTADALGRTHSLAKLRAAVRDPKYRRTAVGFCIRAELYKRLGDPRASRNFEQAIDYAKAEPAFELFYGDYLRLYRGAEQQPLFPAAEAHLSAGLAKLSAMSPELFARNAWNAETKQRLQRSLTALYERDGFQLARRKVTNSLTNQSVSRPWLFFSPGAQAERSTDDIGQTSDVRDLTSAALFSENSLPYPYGRLERPLTEEELAGMARIVTPVETDGIFRRYDWAPVVDLSVTARQTANAEITNYFVPDAFNSFKLLDFGLNLQEPFTIAGTTDALVGFRFDRIIREGLIEFHPEAKEHLEQYQTYGGLSRYLGPDRVNLSYTYIHQDIDPLPFLLDRDRDVMGGRVDYQLFRPLPGQNLNKALGRLFETRGIDLFTGTLYDKELYRGMPTNPALPKNVYIRRRDYFVGVTARGLGRFDATIQPTWFGSRVSDDSTQDNSQLRVAGNVLMRILDEERTAVIPSQRFLGLPVAFVEFVFPFHWDTPRGGLPAFQSRSVGAELSAKLFSNSQSSFTILSTAGYSHDWFPLLGKNLNLARVSLSVGF